VRWSQARQQLLLADANQSRGVHHQQRRVSI
jgi:hypothetical protein